MTRLSHTGAQSSNLGQSSLLWGEKLHEQWGLHYTKSRGVFPWMAGLPLTSLYSRGVGVREERTCTQGSICLGDLLGVQEADPDPHPPGESTKKGSASFQKRGECFLPGRPETGRT